MESSTLATILAALFGTGGISYLIVAWMKIWCPYRLKMEAIQQKGSLSELRKDLTRIEREKESLVERLTQERINAEAYKRERDIYKRQLEERDREEDAHAT